MATRKKTDTRTWKDRAEHYEQDLDRRALSGLTKAVLFVKSTSQKAVPVRTGNLRASAFVVIDHAPLGGAPAFKDSDAGARMNDHAAALARATAETTRLSVTGKHAGAVGYSALYALAVHENPDAGAAGFEAAMTGTNARKRNTQGQFVKQRVERVHSKVGGEKFLENPVRETMPRVRQILKAEGQKARVK